MTGQLLSGSTGHSHNPLFHMKTRPRKIKLATKTFTCLNNNKRRIRLNFRSSFLSYMLLSSIFTKATVSCTNRWETGLDKFNESLKQNNLQQRAESSCKKDDWLQINRMKGQFFYPMKNSWGILLKTCRRQPGKFPSFTQIGLLKQPSWFIRCNSVPSPLVVNRSFLTLKFVTFIKQFHFSTDKAIFTNRMVSYTSKKVINRKPSLNRLFYLDSPIPLAISESFSFIT